MKEKITSTHIYGYLLQYSAHAKGGDRGTGEGERKCKGLRELGREEGLGDMPCG